MNRKFLKRLMVSLFLMGSLVGGSCSPSESDVIRTRGLSADFVATSHSSGETQISATLRSSFDDVELTGGDRLAVTYTDPVTLAESELGLVADRHLFGVSYDRSFQGNEKDTLIEVALDRTSTESVSALDSRVTLPTPFLLRWVSSTTTRESVPLDFSRSSNATRYVIWDPYDAPDFEVGDVLAFSITGTCIEPYSGVIDWEQGEDALELTNTLRDAEAPNAGLSCLIEVEMTLSREGEIDSAFKNGTFVAEQVRMLTLLARP